MNDVYQIKIQALDMAQKWHAEKYNAKDGYTSQRFPSDEEVLKLAQKYFEFIYAG